MSNLISPCESVTVYLLCITNINLLFFFSPRFLHGIAYRQFTRLVHGRLKEKIIPLPACAYHAIRSTFKVEGDNFGGYEELVSEQE